MGRILAEITPNSKEHFMMLCKPTDFDMIYNKVMRLTGENHSLAEDVANWCELATIGEIYEFSDGKIEIKEGN